MAADPAPASAPASAPPDQPRSAPAPPLPDRAEVCPAPLRHCDEIARQRDALLRERVPRLGLTVVAFALATIYLPLWTAAVLLAVFIATDTVALHLMRGLQPASQIGAHRLSVLAVFVQELAYASVAALIWQQDAQHAKAFALGLLLVMMVHLISLRIMHLPYAIAGFAGGAFAILTGNMVYWVRMMDGAGLALSTLCAVAGLGYTWSAILSNHRLHRAMAEGQAAARAADAAKSRFLAQMSHELRTPLNAIIGLGHAERDRAANDLSRQRLAALVTSAQGLAVILDDILDLSAVNEGHLTLRPRDFDLHAELAATLALFDLQARAGATGLSLRLAPDLPRMIRQDPQRLRQCVTNLVSNALRHAGGAEVSLAAFRDAQGMLCVEVTDTGPGIAPAIRQTLFQPFQTGPDTRTGTGLGLSISRSLARRMGGDLVLVPTPQGARFRLTVACEGMAPSRAPVPEAAFDHDPGAMPDLGGRSILVVDDIATNRLVAASYLARSRARVIEAAGGAEAVQIMARGGIDLVLLDMNMPGLDGPQTLRRIRALPGVQVPVLAMTADVMPSQRDGYLAAGMDDHLAKPLSPQVLAAALRRHLAR
ncbi:MAG: ATP-binding protein [Pseudomonadota bacterium]